MAEGSRMLPEIKQKQNPTFFIDNNFSGFVEGLQVGEKGMLNILGTVIRERKDEEEDKIFKTVKVLHIEKLGDK